MADLGFTFNGDDYPDIGPLSAIGELRQHKQWVCWDYVLRPGATKATKPPKSPHTGLGASHAKPSDWGTYEQAEACAKRRNFAGVGFVLSEDDDFTGIDLDKCRDPETKKLDLWAEDIVALGETYWEVSPSGTGLRAIVRGKIAKTVKCDTAHVEVYRSLRYLTITGQQIPDTPDDIRPAPLTLEWLMDRVEKFAPKEVDRHPIADPEQTVKQETALVGHHTQNDAGAHAWADAALGGVAADLASSDEGGRNHALNASAYRLGRMVARGWLERSRVVAALTDACRTNGLFKDDGANGVRATLASGLRAGMQNPHEDLLDNRADDAELLAAGNEIAQRLIAHDAKAKAASGAGVAEAPRALFRVLAPASAYPVEALGPILAPAANAIVDRVQCPDALAAQSVLAAASLAAQAHADVEIPATGHAKPCSLFIISVAASGERKSAADAEALWPVRKYEKALREAYATDVPEYLKLKAAFDAARKKALEGKDDRFATKSKLDAVGEEPPKPLEPMLTCGEPTFEGLCKILAAGPPAMGIFSDEGGSFIGGHGMSPDAKLRTAAGLSGVWDGSPIKRVRSLDGSSIIAGKRVALHLMAQPEAAARMLTDPVLSDQGFPNRLLVSAPASTAGTRFQREPDPASGAALNRYHARILSILERAPTLALDSRNELDPRVLRFAPDAAKAWREYADYVERLLGPGQLFESIRGFANKLPEHAARIATVLTLVDDIEARHINVETFERAVHLAEYYTGEALRLFEAGYASPELRQAETLRKWLLTKWKEPLVSARAIVTFGPNAIRDSATAKGAIKVLVEHYWLVPIGAATVDGKNVREAWKITKEDAQ
jgi:hypothetical protein